jgi:ABC-type multidrug transport system fused ATPase/permease subunit
MTEILPTIRQIRDLLSPTLRRRVWPLLALMITGTVFESLSVGLVVPALAILADPTWIDDRPQIDAMLRTVGADTPGRIAIWTMLSLVAAYAAKTAVTALLKHWESRFAYTAQCDAAVRLYSTYLRQPWTFHLKRNSAELIRNSTEEPVMLGSFLSALLPLISESLVVLALGIVLICVEPLGALVAMSTLAGAATLFNWSVRSRVQSWGEARQHLQGGQVRHLQQGIAAAKEIKLAGCESHFERLFERHTRALAHTRQRQDVVSQLPRLWLEMVSITGIAALVVTLVIQDRSFAAALPSLGLFAAAAFRLLPSITRIMTCVHTMRFRLPAIRVLHAELHLLAPANRSATRRGRPHVDTICLRDVSFRYPDAEADVLSGVRLEIPAGAMIGFLGPSGAGKSTLVDMILGLLMPTSGAVEVNAHPIVQDLDSWQRAIGYVPQSIYLLDDTIRRNVAFGLEDSEVDDQAVWRALDQAQLGHYVRDLPDSLDTVTGERGVRLSGGQRQRIGIARALYHDPDVLVLDEATSALDVATESEVMQAIISLHGHKTVLIVAHRLSTLSRCDAVYRLEHGSLETCKIPAPGVP